MTPTDTQRRGKTVDVKCANKRCGAMFTARIADRARGWGKFCSKSCKAIKQEARTGQHRSHGMRQIERSDFDGSWDAHNCYVAEPAPNYATDDDF